MKFSRSIQPSRASALSLLAVFSISFVLSATTSLVAGPGLDHWTRKQKDTSSESSVPMPSGGSAEKVAVECNSCKIVQVKSQQPSQNGRFQQVRTEEKIVCDAAERSSAPSCCAPASIATPSQADANGR
jgi:hypothetical protein